MFKPRTKTDVPQPTRPKRAYDAMMDQPIPEDGAALSAGVAQFYGSGSMRALRVAVLLTQDIHQLPETTIELIAKNRDEAERFSKELLYTLQQEGEKFVFFDKADEAKDVFAERLAKYLFVTTRRARGIPVKDFLWLYLGDSLDKEAISERSGIPRGLISKTYATIVGKMRRRAKMIQRQVAAEEKLQQIMRTPVASDCGGESSGTPQKFDQVEFHPGAEDGADAGAENGEVPEAT